MIIDKEKLIFIHIPKTAGTSIRSYMARHCSWDKNRVRQPKKHASIKEIKNEFPVEYETYKKFAIIRNPYDRIVSYFFYLKRLNNYYVRGIDFKIWLNYLVDIKKENINNSELQKTFPQNSWVDDTVSILKFENLEKEINSFFKKEIKLPKTNTSNHQNFLEYYDENSLNNVYNIFKEDFEKFNYKKL
tara:strand:- start:11 stop:574 length:564 start_codon:yes stop_codon:yes gene_type:complete